ncbi:MAG: hypothetical protein ACPGQL_08135 [Thermoplasmatota archaeon]
MRTLLVGMLLVATAAMAGCLDEDDEPVAEESQEMPKLDDVAINESYDLSGSGTSQSYSFEVGPNATTAVGSMELVPQDVSPLEDRRVPRYCIAISWVGLDGDSSSSSGCSGESDGGGLQIGLPQQQGGETLYENSALDAGLWTFSIEVGSDDYDLDIAFMVDQGHDHDGGDGHEHH